MDTPTPTPDPRILIVDNHETVAEAIAIRLQNEGYTCVTAYDGTEGLAAFQAAPFDLIISDLNMPGGDGISLVESVRQSSDVPIIFVTGYRSEYKPQLRELPGVVLLTKPFEDGALIDLVETELALHRP